MTPPLLAVRELRVAVPVGGGRAHAVDGVSFDVAAGERVGIVGESGAGKSLTALALPGLLPPGARIGDGSSVRFEGRELVGAPERELRHVRGGGLGMVFQDPSGSLDPVLTVGRQLREVLSIHQGLAGGAARREAVRLLEAVGLPEPERTFDDPPHRLSGGMRQRAAIALALAGRPRLLVADEPTTALDVTVQARILERIVTLTEERGLGLLLVTHDLAVVAGTCHRVLVLYAGQVVEEGPVGNVLSSPLHPYTRALLTARPRMDGPREVPRPIPGDAPTPGAWPAGCRFHPRCARVMDRCREQSPPAVAQGDRTARCWLHVTPESP